jgi:hypothetical protein
MIRRVTASPSRANRRRDDANPSQYVCEYIVIATTQG